MNKLNTVDDAVHLRELLPQDCVDECSFSGDNYPACEKWVEELSLSIPRDRCIEMIKDLCAFEDEEIEDLDDKELNIRALWIAAGYEL